MTKRYHTIGMIFEPISKCTLPSQVVVRWCAVAALALPEQAHTKRSETPAQKSPIYPQKSPTYPQKSPILRPLKWRRCINFQVALIKIRGVTFNIMVGGGRFRISDETVNPSFHLIFCAQSLLSLSSWPSLGHTPSALDSFFLSPFDTDPQRRDGLTKKDMPPKKGHGGGGSARGLRRPPRPSKRAPHIPQYIRKRARYTCKRARCLDFSNGDAASTFNCRSSKLGASLLTSFWGVFDTVSDGAATAKPSFHLVFCAQFLRPLPSWPSLGQAP